MKSFIVLAALILINTQFAQASEKDCSDSDGIRIVREVR